MQVVTAALSLHQLAPAKEGEKAEAPEERLPVAEATPNTARLHEDSAAAGVRQQGALLATVLGALAGAGPASAPPSLEFLSGLLDVHHEDSAPQVSRSVLELLPYLLLIFYERASPRDLPLRHAWLQDLAEQRLHTEASRRHVDLGNCLRFALQVSTALHDALQRVVGNGAHTAAALAPAVVAASVPSSDDDDTSAALGLPWDMRWLAGGVRLLRANAARAYAATANRAALLARFLFLAQVEAAASSSKDASDERQTPRSRAQRTITVREYSAAVSEGKLLDSVTSHPLILQFQPLLQQIDVFIHVILSSEQVAVSDEEWATLDVAFAWRFHLAEQGTLQLVGEPGNRLVDLAVARLTVHTRWFLKYLLPPLQALSEKDPNLKENKYVKKLSSTLKLISSSMKSSQTALHRIGKKLRRAAGQPLPSSSAEQSTLAQRIERLVNLLHMWPSSDPSHMQLLTARIPFLLSNEGKEARRCLTNAIENTKKSGCMEMVLEKVEQAEQICEKAGFNYKVGSGTGQKNRPQEEKNSINAEVQLWPIQEFIALSLEMLFLKELLQTELCNEDKKLIAETSCKAISDKTILSTFKRDPRISMSLCSLLEELPSIPAEMLAMIHQLSYSNSNVNIPLCEIVHITLKHHTLSPARCLATHWLSWNLDEDLTDGENIEELITDFEMSQDSFPMHCPLLTCLVTNHVVPKASERNLVVSNLITQIPLGNQHPTTFKLNKLLELLWRNMSTLSSQKFNHKLNDSHCALATVLKLKETLNSVLLDASKSSNFQRSSEGSVAEKFDAYVNSLSEENVPEVLLLSKALHNLEEAGNNLAKLLKEEAESDVLLLVAAGQTWLLVGCIQIILLTKFGYFDPVEKRIIQLLYTIEEHKNTSQLLYARELQARLTGLSLVDQQSEELHPFVLASHQRLILLTNHENELRKNLAYRPSVAPYYTQLLKEANHYSISLGSAEMVLELHRKLLTSCTQLQECIQDPAPIQSHVQQLTVAANDLLNEERMWRNSQRIFCSRLQKTYNLHFPDMVAPLLSAAQQLCRGTGLLASIIQKLLVRLKFKLAGDIVKLVQFPVAICSQGIPLGVVNLCLDRVFCQQLQQLLHQDDNDFPVKQETYRLMKAGLEDIRNVIAAQGNIDITTWTLLLEILSRIVNLWVRENDKRKQNERDKDQIFIQKGITRCENLSDDQLEALGLQELFPTTADDDFGDLQREISLESTSLPRSQPDLKHVEELVSSEDMMFVCQLHFELMRMFTRTEWVAPPSSCVVRPNFVSPLLQRFQSFRQLLNHIAPGLDSSVDWHLAPSLALLASLALRAGCGDTVNGFPSATSGPVRQDSVLYERPFDFYHDTNVEESRQCLPTLNAILKRTKELKQEWPEHPTLDQILVVIERIMSFPIISPVSRFLTGLEILLEKLQDWEENAHSGVSLATHIQLLTNQIIAWRRLELQCWKDCLNTAAYKMTSNASHWWFHVFCVIEEFKKVGPANKVLSEKDLIKSMQEFMEKSLLGDFHARLNILFSFHCHSIHLPPSSRQRKLVCILWNLHQFYNQFSEAINLKIHDLRTPVEKQIRDFVKIARWNDISYWSVKTTVDKTRRTLLKHVRKFETVLKQPVSSVLSNPHPVSSTLLSETAGKLDRPQRGQTIRHTELPPDFYTASGRLRILFSPNVTPEKADSLVSRAQSLFNKSRKLSKEALSVISYPDLIQTADEFTISMIHTVNHLKDLEIPSNVSKERRKTVAKSHLQLKKKALTDAFRTLQQMGLSFRRGSAAWNDEETMRDLFDFSLLPLDLNVGIQHPTFQMCGAVKSTSKGSRPDGELAAVWDGSETYFYRSMARLSILNTLLENPHQNIGPPLIERLRGFTSHLMIYAKMQKAKLTESFDSLRSLRCYMSHIASLKKNDSLLPRQSELHQCWKKLNNLLVNIIVCTEQFMIFLDACPRDITSSFTIDVSEESGVSDMNSAVYGDLCWQNVTKKVKNILVTSLKLKAALNKSWIDFPEIPNNVATARGKIESELLQVPKNLITHPQFELMIEGFEQINGFKEELKSVVLMFEKSAEDNVFNPMTQCLKNLEKLIEKEVRIFNEIETPSSSLKGLKKSGIEIEDKELEICISAPSDIKTDSDSMSLDIDESKTSTQQFSAQISLSSKHLNENDKKQVVEAFGQNVENLLETTLIAIQRIYKTYSAVKSKDTTVEGGNQEHVVEESSKKIEQSQEEEEGKIEGEVLENHLKEKILKNLLSDLSDLQIPKVNELLSKLIQRLVAILDLENWENEASQCKGILLSCIPCIDQLSLLYQFFVKQQAAAYRVTCKMLSVVLSVSIDLAQKGFCIPQDLMPEEGEEAGDPKGGMGLGEGEGEKDVSDKIESEDQLEDARQPDEGNEDEDKDCKEEEQGIETSQDFGGKIQDIDKKEDEDESGVSGDEEEEEPDKEMGETGEGAEKLDKEVWGSDSEDEDEKEEEKEDEVGEGEKTGNPELSAKDDKREANEESEEEDGHDGSDKKEKQKDINEFEEPEFDEDQVDPFHGKHQPYPEPEPLDLPEDVRLDDEDGKDGAEEEDNPFDIDAMKERKIPEEEEKETVEPEDDEPKEDQRIDSSDDEEEGGDQEKNGDEINDPQDGDNEEKNENEEGNEDGMKDEMNKEEKSEEELKQENKASPSDDLPSEAPAQAADMEIEASEASKDRVAENTNEQKDNGKQDTDDLGEEGGDEEQGVGQAQAEEQKTGHRGHMAAPKDKLPSTITPPDEEEKRDKRQRPGESDSKRSLGDVSEQVKKRLKTFDIKKPNEKEQEDENDEEKDENEEGAEEGRQGEMYQHIKNSKEPFDTQTLDAATQEQAEKQPVPNKEEEPSEEAKPEDDVGLHEDDVIMDEEIKKQTPEQLQSGKKDKNSNKPKQTDEKDEDDTEMVVDIEGDVVPTQAPNRGAETTFHTQYNFGEDGLPFMRESDLQDIRQELENQLSTWTQPPADAEAFQAWQNFVAVTAGLSRELSEQLRLVLEPTQAARLRGDYRTGRRINMRKVIPYIASQFRKDKIWLRRTKPSKREYQIVLAIDDSSSMADNHTKELAFESLALLSRALSLLEAGELAIVSFGDSPRILHQLGDSFTEHSGGRLLQEFSFAQKHTKVGQLVDFCTMLLQDSRKRVSSTSECAQLLMIVSDGRGVFSEGDEKVRLAIRLARQSRIFMVFVILDNPDSKNSILDIRAPVFQGGKLLGIKSYLDSFPFPFYLILQDINSLPAVLSDALRQWFELVTNTDSQ